MIYLARGAATALLFLAANALAADHVTLIHAGELLAVPGSVAVQEQDDCRRGRSDRRSNEGFVGKDSFDGAADIIDLSDKFVLPGLMDMHVHLQGELGPDNDRDKLKMSKQLMQMRSLLYAMNTLKAGFTTVRDVGSSAQEMFAMRDAINKRLDRRPEDNRGGRRRHYRRARRYQRRQS